MNTLLNKSIAGALALTVLITISSDEAYAQRGRSLRGKLQGNFSSNKGGGNSSFSNQSFSLRNSSTLQGNSNRRLGQQNNTGSIFSNNGIGSSNLGNTSSRFPGLTRGNLQNVLQNSNSGANKNWIQNLNNNKGLKQLGNKGLQSILGNGNGTPGNNPLLKNLGQANIKHDFGSKVQNWLNNQQFNGGNGSKLANLILHNHNQGHICVDHDHWCHAKPKHCHWWYNWCKPIAYCDPHHYVHCQWNYVTCDYIVNGHVVVEDCRWYLGLKGLLLPGQGVGIEEVAPGSPAAAVGLQPGMVITRCNGIDLIDETVLAQVITQSGGVLQMDLLLSANGPPATCVVVMQRVHAVNF